MTDWSRWRKCPVYHAAINEPCLWMTDRPRDMPHSSRVRRNRVKS